MTNLNIFLNLSPNSLLKFKSVISLSLLILLFLSSSVKTYAAVIIDSAANILSNHSANYLTVPTQTNAVSDIICSFSYDSQGNPESFTRIFPAGSEDSFLIGQMTVHVKTELPKDKSLLKKFTILNFEIWDDTGSELSNQPEFKSHNVLVSRSQPVNYQIKVRNLAVPDYPETYRADCHRQK